ncbi:class F sortase [Streptacidiphilus rugosus]|uniref:class F sortase n=1 Tax=Streptacidiphilus rugosus TaxID=405783 RepID=UPI0007C6E827|nr:class F sortase [Streptacidiphilus rugosus]
MSWAARQFGRGRRRLLASAAAALLTAAGGTVALGLSGQQHAPQPPASAALPAAAPRATTSVPTAPAAHAATPTAISIPAIGVHHALLSLGQNSDGTLQVPPMSDVSAPGWDRNSPSPGQVGPAVIVGHIDGTTGAEGVFYALGALRPGDTVAVTRSDGTVAVFRIDGVNTYSKAAFPTLTVYGNTTDPQLRLITCGGRFDHATQHYLDNTVAFATLTGIHRG